MYSSNIRFKQMIKQSYSISVETNYQGVFYFTDAVLGVTFLVVLLFLEVKVEKNKERFVPSFKKIFNPASATFLLLIFSMGIEMGIGANYVIIYLQEDLKASSAMVGKCPFWLMCTIE